MTSYEDLHLHSRTPYTIERKTKYRELCLPLHQSATTGNWDTARRVISKDKDVVYASITDGEETALHLAAIGGNENFVKKLISEMHNLDTPNSAGITALCFAAAGGNLKIVELIVNRNAQLHTIQGSHGLKPIYTAASVGHRDIVNYLYGDLNMNWPPEEKAPILTACIDRGLHDVALRMIKADNRLLIVEDGNKETTLDVLVRMSSEFADKNEKPSCKNLLEDILEIILITEDTDISKLISKFPDLLFTAANLGNMEFLVTLLRKFPDMILTKDADNRSIFHIAISKKHLGIFNLIYESRSMMPFLTHTMDQDGNNMLHLAAKLAAQDELNMVSVSALQMQRELLWYKEVSDIVPPAYRNMRNKDGKTPSEIFVEEHKILMAEGKNWMTTTAKASLVVATIIASVVFTTIFTVPGGVNEETGVPNMSHKPFMTVFYISEAIALLSSSISILMFLSIHTSRYAQIDFLHSLPLKLLIGITALVFSLGAMVLAFCTTILLSYHHGFFWSRILLGVFSLVPLLYLLLKVHLLCDVFCSIYNARNMFRSKNRLSNSEE